MRKIVVAFIAVGMLSIASPATARPIVTDHPKDVCKNVRGIQTAQEVETGYWRFIERTKRPNDCKAGRRTVVIDLSGDMVKP